MALWQFKIELIPQSWIDSGGVVEALFSEEGVDPSIAWARYYDSRLEERLSSALQNGKSWHSDLALWGDLEEDDIQLWRDQGKVESIQAPFDLRNPNLSLFQAIVDIARDLGLAILAPDIKMVVPWDTQELLRVAMESNAARFVDDPHSFLQQVGQRVQEQYNKALQTTRVDTCD
jgi:hypothetical protein